MVTVLPWMAMISDGTATTTTIVVTNTVTKRVVKKVTIDVIIWISPAVGTEGTLETCGRQAAKQEGDEHMTEPRKIARYGWIPDLPDERDHIYAAPPQFLSALPPSTDLRSLCPGVYDQGMLGSCTANAIGVAISFH